jgi:hypothetical protein
VDKVRRKPAYFGDINSIMIWKTHRLLFLDLPYFGYGNSQVISGPLQIRLESRFHFSVAAKR